MHGLKQAASWPSPAVLTGLPRFAASRRAPKHGPPSDGLIGKRVEVYYNLHEKRLSLRGLEAPHRGKVVGHADTVLIEDATFVVQPGGRRRVLKEKQKNVHAFVRGILKSFNGLLRMHPKGVEAVTYNPYKYDSFVKAATEAPVNTADQVFIQGKRILARGLREKPQPAKKAARP